MCTLIIFYFCVIATLVVVMQSCSHSDNHGRMGIDQIVTINSKYSILCFDTRKCSSGNISSYMNREKYRCVKISELNSLLSQLERKQRRHAKVYNVDEFSKETTDILKKISVVVVKLEQHEKYCPFFHVKKGQMFADWGDFLSGWSESDHGYFVVAKNSRR